MNIYANIDDGIELITFINNVCQVTQRIDLENINRLYKSKNFTQAIAEIVPLITKYPNNGNVNHLYGRLLTEIKDYKKAMPYLLKTIQIDNNRGWLSAWSYAYLGKCYYFTNEPQKSCEALNKCIEMKSTQNSVDFAKGMISDYKVCKINMDYFNTLYQSKKYAEALKEIEKHYSAQPNDLDIIHMYGRILTENKKYSEAIPILLKAIQLDYNKNYITSWSLAFLGKCYHYMGDDKKASENLKKAVKMNATKHCTNFAKELITEYGF